MDRFGPWGPKPGSAPSPASSASPRQSARQSARQSLPRQSVPRQSLHRGSQRNEFSLPSSGACSVVGDEDEPGGKVVRNKALYWVQSLEPVPKTAPGQMNSSLKLKERLVETIVLPPKERKNFFKPDPAASWEGFYAKTLEAAKRPPAMAVVLLYSGEFSPFTTCDLDALQRARNAIHTRYPDARVVGAVVAPFPDKRCAKPPPFRARVELARKIVGGTQHNNWIVVDGCLEGCLRKCEGSIAPHVAVYARSRLHCPGCRAKVVEISTTDTLVATGEPIRPFDALFVGRGGVEPVTAAAPTLSEVRSVIVDVPKHREMGDALRAEAAAAIALGGLTRRDFMRFE